MRRRPQPASWQELLERWTGLKLCEGRHSGFAMRNRKGRRKKMRLLICLTSPLNLNSGHPSLWREPNTNCGQEISV